MVCSRCKGSGRVPVFFCGEQVESPCPVCSDRDWYYAALNGDAKKEELIDYE